MTSIFRQLVSGLYKCLASVILACWSLFALCLTASSGLGDKKNLLPLISNPSLLTFLVSKLVVVGRFGSASKPIGGGKNQSDSSLAHWISSADYGSPQGALALFIFACTWLWHLVNVLLAMGVLSLMFGLAAFARYKAMNESESHPEMASDSANGLDTGTTSNLTTALTTFSNETGVDPNFLVDVFPIWAILPFILGMWLNVLSLFLYLAGHALNSLRIVLSSSSESWTRQEAQRVLATVQQQSEGPVHGIDTITPETVLKQGLENNK
jgi:hypothetical protein